MGYGDHDAVHVGTLVFADWRRVEGEPLRDDGRLYHYLPPRRVVLGLQYHYAEALGAAAVSPQRLLWISRGGSRARQLRDEPAVLARARAAWPGEVGAGGCRVRNCRGSWRHVKSNESVNHAFAMCPSRTWNQQALFRLRV